jgi:hypothetical protein
MPRRVDDRIRERAMLLYDRHLSAKQIVAELRDDPAVAASLESAPVLRTVQRWIQAEMRRRATERGKVPRRSWQIEDGDAALILPMVAAMAESIDGGLDSTVVEPSITDWARRIGHEFPEIPPLELYFLAHEYLMATSEEAARRAGREKPWLYWSERRWAADLYLAFTPWRDAGARYVEAFKYGLVHHLRPLRTPSTYEALDDALAHLNVEPIEWMTDLPVTVPSPAPSREAIARDEAAFAAWEQDKRPGARAGRQTRKA